eukprot:CAMPEP_0204113778 /NCGR_PEP_ID=MMETSP0361-20130328/3854_1 /ASSEMBLY_ACC=CAM_ASM_000343 /TAXON_ID=268821 /ORGANISM="Scrippsiella Hangoei, Strain SHTV-5" /LENGTH=35 /DNA_ID= /DNA_START= /DNA_END= /DNA_ORIENTATION=
MAATAAHALCGPLARAAPRMAEMALSPMALQVNPI